MKKIAKESLAEIVPGLVNSSPQFADKKAIAEMLGMSTRSVDNFLAAGMPHMKFGARCVRFDVDEVRAWLKAQYGHRRREALTAAS